MDLVIALQGDISPDPKHFLHKYALLKLYESCFGQELLYKVSKLRACGGRSK